MRIAISAGETSGDEHAAGLVRALFTLCPNVEVRGMGGHHLREAGAVTVVDSKHTGGVMGFGAVLGNLGRIREAFSQMKRFLAAWKPDVLVVVDYPDFNMRLARYAKTLGIRVVYFIPPKLWAWRQGRIRRIRKYIDQMIYIFPFEKSFYEGLGYSAGQYVGHPYADLSLPLLTDLDKRAKFIKGKGLDPLRPIVAIFPGSRAQEIRHHARPMLEGYMRLKARQPNIQALVSVASSTDPKDLEPHLPRLEEVAFVQHDPWAVLASSDCGLLKSGTTNLQAAFCELPFAMFYLVSPVTDWIVRNFVRIKQYSLVNIIRPNTVREMIQDEANAAEVESELQRLLFDREYQESLHLSMKEVKQKLSSHDPLPLFANHRFAYDRAAALVLANNP